MNRLLRFFRPLVVFSYRYPLVTIVAALALAAVSGFYAMQLRIDTDLANLLPSSNEHVQALERLQETLGGETEVEVAIASPDFEANRAFAEDLIPEMLDLHDPRTGNPFYERAEFTRDTGILKDYALYLATDREIREITEYLEHEIDRARMEANPFFVDLEEDFEDEDEEQADLERFQQTYDRMIPPRYPVNQDSTVMVLTFNPTGSRSDITFLEDMFAATDSLLAAMEPGAYHPEMHAEAGGHLRRHLQEIDAIVSDVMRSFGSGIGSIILLVMLFFSIKQYLAFRRSRLARESADGFWRHVIRLPMPVLVIAIPLLISLSYTFGIAYAGIGTLNTMTSVLFVILFGLGIDYGIHYYARYIEQRADGASVRSALLYTYDNTGGAIMTSGLTTALALFVLIAADFRGFSEFGFIAGLGIVLALLAMIILLPAMLVAFERYGLLLIYQGEGMARSGGAGAAARARPAEADEPGGAGHGAGPGGGPGEPAGNPSPSHSSRFPFARTVVCAVIALVIFIGFNLGDLRFEYDFGTLEPEFTQHEEFRELTSGVQQDERRNPAYFVADTDEQVMEIVEELRSRMQQHGEESTIQEVEALQERFPANREQEQRKLEQVAQVRELLQNEFIREEEDEQLDQIRRASRVTEPLDLDQVPEFLKNRFLNREGEIGRFVVVYPGVGLADGRNSIAFKNEIGRVETSDGQVHHAASTSIAAAEMLELMMQESPYMVAATFIMILILVNLAFRSLRWAIIALLPLAMGFLWTFGAMLLFGLSLNFYNLVVLPAILGIGNDNGVHLASRYREEGPGSMRRVLTSTGQHISVGSITTMLGFAGLLLTDHPGLNTIGLLAVIGIGLTLLSALTFLPALVQWLEDRGWIRY